jgi:hypothetical protein
MFPGWRALAFFYVPIHVFVCLFFVFHGLMLRSENKTEQTNKPQRKTNKTKKPVPTDVIKLDWF